MASYPNLTIKDESNNSYGTYKDRRSKFIVEKAVRSGVSHLCLITSGNAGYSLAKYAILKGIHVTCIVHKDLKVHIKEKLLETGASVIEIDLGHQILKSEHIISLIQQDNKEIVWDVTNGFSQAYESIIDEMKDEPPDFIICPVGSGEAFVGLYQGIQRNNLPSRLIGVGVQSYPSFADKLGTPWTPYGSGMAKIISKGHILVRLAEDEVVETYEKYKDKYQVEPSSAVVWAGLIKAEIDTSKKIVLINSGKGIF